MVNLILALIWLGLAVFVFAHSLWNPPVAGGGLLAGGQVVGYAALALVAYNLIRWWTGRRRNSSRNGDGGHR